MMNFLPRGIWRDGTGREPMFRKDLPPLPPLSRPAPNTAPRWLRKASPLAREESIPSQVIAFRLGIPSLSSLPPRVWREAWATVIAHLPPDGYGPANGD